MRKGTVVVSAAIHVLVFGVALQAAHRTAPRRATAVAVVGERKKKEAPNPPPPRPKPAAPRPRPAAPEPLKNAPSRVTSEAAPAPVETNLELSNDDTGPGIAVGPPRLERHAPAPSAPKQAPAHREKRLAPRDDDPEADTCTEAPSKPVPIRRTEIEYTQEARANDVEGRMVLRVTVGSDGAVLKVEVLQKVDPQLDAAVVAAIEQWVFRPSMRCGKPMAGGVYTIAKDFELSD